MSAAGDLNREADLARALAREAGRVILDVYATDFAVEEKAGGEGPVTQADKRANALIVGGLRAAFPDDGVVAEESADNRDAGRFTRCWFVDPLDGTREFVARNGEFAVHIGLAIAGEVKLGVVFLPVSDKLYTGVVGAGAELEADGTTRTLHVSAAARPREVRLLVSRSHRTKRTEHFCELAGIPRVIERGSVGLKCGLIAEGAAEAYVHASPRSSRWDSCAPEAVLKGAGGLMTDLFGEPYRYDGVELRNLRGLVGSNATALPIIRRALDALLAEGRR